MTSSALLAVLAALAASRAAPQEPRATTWAADVEPIVRARCMGCHSPGQAGPFALTSLSEVSKRASVIADVVERRVMPPWLPVPDGGGPFVGERRLGDAERSTLLAWLAQGCAPGDLARVPAPPSAESEWQLGPPDLVLKLEPACEVPLEGRDVYQNFVIPVPLTEVRFVRALEFEPGNRRVLHHAVIGVDSSGAARALDARDPAPGFRGMNLGGARLPDGQFLGWAPGKRADPGRDDLAWRLAPGDDLVLQMHLRPSGKPETIRPRIGLHFAQMPPTRHASAIVLSALDLDIPAGASDYATEREYRLPVAASVLAIAPHAHYIGHDLSAWATLPDGKDVPLIRLAPWDFNWQDSYRYVEPVPLPAGAVIRMRYVYDNSDANTLNPHAPPEHVVYGESSTDEMGELLVQLLAAPEERETLERDFAGYAERQTLAYLEGLLARTPGDARLAYSIGLSHERLGELPQALESLRAVNAQRPKDALVRSAVARVLARTGDLTGAERELELARADLSQDPRARQAWVAALVLVGDALRAKGDADSAKRCYERALKVVPDDRAARERLGR